MRLTAPPVFFARANGARLWDVDGREYVDYLLGQGPAFLGHAHERVTRAVYEACTEGMLFGAQHPLEVEAAERVLTFLPWADMVRFGVSGTECMQGALRLARAATGRRRFLRLDGHYHGWLDNVLLAFSNEGPHLASEGQLPDVLDDCVTVPYNDARALEDALAADGDDIAAVIMEPVMFNQGAILPEAGYLERVRNLCSRYGVVLIFDEVICGFRVAPGGAAQRFGVTPDLATYGKAVGGGWPVAALAGRGDLMERLGTGAVNHAGTFNGSVMAAAAVLATLDQLVDNSFYERIEEHGRQLMAQLPDLGREHDVPIQVQGLPCAFHVSFGEHEPVRDAAGLRRLDQSRYARFTHRLAHHGLWVAERGIWYVSAAHGDTELRDAIDRVEKTLLEMSR